MLILGHRGVAGHRPENTIASFRAAVDMELDGVEFDVRVTADLVPVVIHDATLDRTTTGSGIVNELTLEQLSNRTVTDEHAIPLLKDVVWEVCGFPLINVELKEYAAWKPALAVLETAVANHKLAPSQILITSFEHESIRALCRESTQFPVGLLTRGLPDEDFWSLADELNAASVNIDLAAVDRAFVQRAHRGGMQAMVYTVNDSSQAANMRKLGVDAIFSDFPDRVRS